MKSCSNCSLYCSGIGCSSGLWQLMHSEGMSNEAIANYCTYYKEVMNMYGYIVDAGYMGLVDGEFMLFATEAEYKEYLQ